MSNLTIHLTVLLFWPLALALLGATGPRSWAPGAAIVGAVVPFAYAVMMLFDYDSAAGGLQYVTNDEWIKALGIRYKLGVDGLNLWLIALTTLLFLVAAMWLSFRPVERPRLFTFHLALAETAVLGAFIAQDLALFVLFFDLMLVPFYFLVGQWGSGPDRVAATYKMIIYTLVGSLLMLAGAVATAVLSADGGTITFTLSDLAQAHLGASTQRWIFIAFALAFLIKMPLFPFHGWMPDAYRTMPLPALAIFSGVLSKVAAYGFLRIVLPLFPEAAKDFQSLILILALLSIIYGSAQAFTQTNARLVLGYSSIAQLGFIVLGIFAHGPGGAGRAGRAAADGQPRARGGAAVPDHRAAVRADGDRGHHEDGRARVPRAGAGRAVPDRRARDAGDAGVGELRRRVPDPARAVPDQAGDRDHRVHGRGDGVGLHAADVHPHHAQPAAGDGRRVA